MIWKLTVLFFSSILIVNLPFLPLRPAIMAVYLAKEIHWFFVALTCILGTTIGVIPLYFATTKASDLGKVKTYLNKPWVKKIYEPIKNNLFLLIILFNISPLPDFLIGPLAGTGKYNFKKFILANLIGRIIYYFPFALAGHYFSGDIDAFENFIINLIKSFMS
jgi:membrane protein YqaA with SNARE-associated domain